jgi:hypothetical protein
MLNFGRFMGGRVSNSRLIEKGITLTKEPLKRLWVMLSQPINKIIDVEHIRSESLSSNANGIVWVLHIEIKENESQSKKHAKGFHVIIV